jgi:hypothetical protein
VFQKSKRWGLFCKLLALQISVCYFHRMKLTVHITKDDSFSNLTFDLIEDFLNSIISDSFIKIKFHKNQNQGVWTDQQCFDDVEEDYKRYLFANNLLDTGELSFLDSFQSQFDYCLKFRKLKRTTSSHFVVVLTGQRNEPNWFGFIDSKMKNVFVCESNWTGYFRFSVESYLPLAHEIICWIIRAELFNNQHELIKNIHQEDRGCIMDMNRSRSQISRKMKSTEICDECQEFIRVESTPIISYLNEALSKINFQLKHLNYKLRNSTPSRISLKGEKQKIYLVDYKNLKVNLEPLQTAVYLLFLRHENGINVAEAFTKSEKRLLTPIHQELANIYCELNDGNYSINLGSKVQSIKSRDAQEIRRDISVIKKKFISMLGVHLGEKYIIEQDFDTNRHVLRLDRSLVSYD